MNSKGWSDVSDLLLVFIGASAALLGNMWGVGLFVVLLVLFFGAREMAKKLKLAESLANEAKIESEQVSGLASVLKFASDMRFSFHYESIARVREQDGGPSQVKLKKGTNPIVTLRMEDFEVKYIGDFFVLYNEKNVIAFFGDQRDNALVFF